MAIYHEKVLRTALTSTKFTIVIGPKIDIKIKMVNDGCGDVDEQVFVEEYIQHVPGKFGAKGKR